MARKRRDSSAPRIHKEAVRRRGREEKRGDERGRGELGRKIFFDSIQSEMMSAANEFPSRVLLP